MADDLQNEIERMMAHDMRAFIEDAIAALPNPALEVRLAVDPNQEATITMQITMSKGAVNHFKKPQIDKFCPPKKVS